MKERFHSSSSDLSVGMHRIRFLPITLTSLQTFFTLTCVTAVLVSKTTHIMKVPQEMHIKPGTFKSISIWN